MELWLKKSARTAGQWICFHKRISSGSYYKQPLHAQRYGM